MKIATFIVIVFSCLALIPSQVAAEPIVSHDVMVQGNATASQCPSSWEGSGGNDEVSTTASGIGQNSIASPTIRSCTGCYLQDGNCVCSTCYDYTN